MTQSRLNELNKRIVEIQQQIGSLTDEALLTAVSDLQELISERAKLENSQIQVDKRAVHASGDVDGQIITGDNNSVINITRVYQQISERPFTDEQAFHDALGRYLHWVERRYGRLDLRGVEKREQQGLSLTLNDIYVSLVAQLTPDRKTRQKRGKEELNEENQDPSNMSQLLGLSNRLIITGGPGSGKTTYLRLIAATVARAIRLKTPKTVTEQLGLKDPLPLPIVVSLSEYNAYRRTHSQSSDPRLGTLIAYISYSLIQQHAVFGLPEDFFERLLVQGQSCLLLLDGLDEVANERERILVRRAVEELSLNAGVKQMVVTSRTRAYQGEAVLPETFRLALVQPMTAEQVDQLAERWCTAVYDALDAEEETSRLQEAIRDLEAHRAARHEIRLADTPLLVTIIAIVHYNQRRLPEQRAELYEKCIEVLLTESHHAASETVFELADWGGTFSEKRGLLALLAFEMMQAGESAGRSVSERQLMTWLRPRLVRRFSEEQATTHLETFIRAMRERGSLLDERGGQYQFTHLTFQEFLAATHLAETIRERDKIVRFLGENDRLSDPWWRETILLTIGYLGMKSVETALGLIEELMSFSTQDAIALAAAELAGTGLLELEGDEVAVKSAVAERIVALGTDTAVNASPNLRMLAGDTLGALGDPRPGVCTLEPELVPISTGSFLMGENELAEIEIQTPYAIARYPVTNAQYRMFVEDGGYTVKWRKCWTEDGWQWRQRIEKHQPKEYKNFGQPNQPRVGVSWYEAIAYVRWLAEKTGKPYRLPTEAEWERASRHTDGRVYPWGPAWLDNIANTSETDINRTTAVGIFPRDTAVCGMLDVSGNVNEWCQTRWQDENYKKYPFPYRPEDGRENLQGDDSVYRVWKGGGWYDDKDNYTLCGARSWYYPNYDNDRYGFRVMLSPFISAL